MVVHRSPSLAYFTLISTKCLYKIQTFHLVLNLRAKSFTKSKLTDCADFFRFSSSEIPFLKEQIVIRRSLICIAYTFRLILQTKHCFQSSIQNPT